MALLAITSQIPREDAVAVEIPETEKRRAGLADWKGAWIIVSEYNYDVLERSFYFEPARPALGRFSRRFLAEVATAFRPALARRASRVDRMRT